ncbi:cytochrome P450 6B1-like, partial [Nymphalis io]|uniref:cytochrome P450 6B1-like n=1 Tax=Inachis io TaxID=171585 RepID=UPI0021674996
NDYWKKKNIPHLKPRLIFGNFSDYILFRKSAPIIVSKICDQFPDEPYVGVFYGTAPALVVKDPKLKNTDYANREAITKNIFFNGGDPWKVFRQNSSPLFTSAKLKNMFPTIKECAKEMDSFLEEEIWEEETYIVGDSFANSESSDKKIERMEVNEDLLVAQCTGFFGAGFETTSSTLNFLLYELAKNKRVQGRVLEDVDAYLSKYGEMPYLEACIDETLRLYPVLGNVTREVMSNYTLPTGLRLQKGDRVDIPVYHIHRHPDFFPDPTSYRPERFFGDEKKKIKQFTFMSFGEGPRVCIGKY